VSLLGTGIDIVEIDRIDASLKKLGEAFVQRILTEDEQARFRASRSPQRFLAKRFAAKEAFGKALGTGIAQGVSWKDIEICNGPSGQPGFILTGKTRKIAEQMGAGPLHLSISDERHYAVAQVIIEKKK